LIDASVATVKSTHIWGTPASVSVLACSSGDTSATVTVVSSSSLSVAARSACDHATSPPSS
jgi:hypothetical protein